MSTMNLQLQHLYTDLKNSMLQLRQQSDPVRNSRKIVDHALLDGNAHYGINTGFGVLANKRISSDDLAILQKNILLSHACGMGDPVPPDITRLMLQLKIHSLSLGYSGVSEQTFKQLLDLEEHGILPWIPSRGSVGASGDLAPLAHMCLPLIGRGEVWNDTLSDRIPAAGVLEAKGIQPIGLQAKDGLALINGTQMMAAYGAFVLERTLGLQRDGTLWSWGNNDLAKLGQGDIVYREFPEQVGVDTDWAMLLAHHRTSGALKKDGSFWACGNNWYSQYGDGTKTTNSENMLFVPGATEKIWVQASMGNGHVIALADDGSVWVWRVNGYG